MQKHKVPLTNPLDWATGRFSASTSGTWGIIERTPTEEEKQKFLNYFQNYLQLLGPLQNEILKSDLYIHAALHQPSGNTETKVLPHFLPIPSLAGRSQKRSDFRLAYTTFTPQTIKHRPLLILHGYAEYGPINFELIARQAGSRLVYVIHWPGHGASDGIRDIPFYAETPSDYTEACLEFLKMIQTKHPEGADIMAHSMGGAILLDTLGSQMGQSYQSLIHHMILVAPMLALKGMGWLSEVLYSNMLTRKLLAFIARNSRKPKPFNFPMKDLTLNVDEQNRILQRQQSTVSDCLVNSESDWILAANAMMTRIQNHTSQLWRYFNGRAIIWAGPNDKITDGPRSIKIFQNLFPKGKVHETQLPHRIHTHPEVLGEIFKEMN